MVSKRLGSLETITLSLGLSTPFYLLIPLSPDLTWLSAFYVIRLGLANTSSPLVNSFFMKLLCDEEKATANSIIAMASQGSSIFTPLLGGRIMERVSLDLPAYLGSGLYVVYAASYYFLLRNEEKIGLQKLEKLGASGVTDKSI